MFEAQLLIASSEPTMVYSPWFPRQGDNAIFTLDLVDATGTILVEVFSKNTEDTGDGGSALTPNSGSKSSPGRTSFELSGNLKELVRYRFTVSGSGNWVLFRMLPPVWFDTVDA